MITMLKTINKKVKNNSGRDNFNIFPMMKSFN